MRGSESSSALTDTFAPVPGHQLAILRRMQVPIALAAAVASISSVDLIIDGIIGYSLSGAPRGAAAELIRWANAQGAPILALDTPSGIDTTTGTVFDPAIRATATMTLALPKAWLRAPGTEPQVGELYLADMVARISSGLTCHEREYLSLLPVPLPAIIQR